MARPAGREQRSQVSGCAPGAAALALLAPAAAVLVADLGPLAAVVMLNAGAIVFCLKLLSFPQFCASHRCAPAPLPDPPPSRPRAGGWRRKCTKLIGLKQTPAAPMRATNDAFIALASTVVVCFRPLSIVHSCVSRRRAPAPLPDPPGRAHGALACAPSLRSTMATRSMLGPGSHTADTGRLCSP